MSGPSDTRMYTALNKRVLKSPESIPLRAKNRKARQQT
jgi:hypothetical protein